MSAIDATAGLPTGDLGPPYGLTTIEVAEDSLTYADLTPRISAGVRIDPPADSVAWVDLDGDARTGKSIFVTPEALAWLDIVPIISISATILVEPEDWTETDSGALESSGGSGRPA